MRRAILVAAVGVIVSILPALGSAQRGAPSTENASECHVKVRAAIIRDGMTVTPVPRLLLRARNDEDGTTYEVRTSFDGSAAFDLPRGEYTLRSASDVVLNDERLAWTIGVRADAETLDVELSGDNATRIEADRHLLQPSDFDRERPAIVTVLTDLNSGTGFLVRSDGLVVTNEHVIRGGEYFAVQFGTSHKRRAIPLAVDPLADVAVLRVSMEGLENVAPSKLASPESVSAVAVGDPVWTIGNPLGESTVMSKGIISKVDESTFLCDMTIDRGSSGGPLFNSEGLVIGVATFRSTSGFAGAIKLDDVLRMIGLATIRSASQPPPDSAELPMEPSALFPVTQLERRAAEKFDLSDYRIHDKAYDVIIYTPLSTYRELTGPNAEPNWTVPSSGLRNVLQILARPRAQESAASKVRREIAEQLEQQTGMKIEPGQRSFAVVSIAKIRLLCDGLEVTPVHPSRVSVDARNVAGSAIFAAFYTYRPEAISTCREVSLEVLAVDGKSSTLRLPKITRARIASDFNLRTEGKFLAKAIPN